MAAAKTSVDVAVERRLRKALLAEFPEHGFLGEETPPIRLDAEFVWALGTGTSLMLLDLQAEWHHLGDADFVTISAGLGF